MRRRERKGDGVGESDTKEEGGSVVIRRGNARGRMIGSSIEEKDGRS